MNKDFKQLCVWHGTTLDGGTSQDLIDFFQKKFGVRIQFEQEVITNPDLDSNGIAIKDTGSRSDLLFYVHNEDVGKFAVPRFSIGVRWWEDVVKYNNNSHLYTKDFLEAKPVTW